jgi:glycosyltransferase involved in cell wall biosynthesis
MNTPRFSVLINNYNYADFVTQAVESAHAQILPAHEIIVVDDGSKDQSVAVLTALKARIAKLVVHSQPNGGQLSAFRKGIELATGDWCVFLDADDEWTPQHLAQAAAVLEANPQVSAYYSGHRETSGPPMYRTKWPEGMVGPVAALVAATRTRVGTITSTIALRRDLARKLMTLDRGFDADWRIRADDCLLFGASLAGAVFYYHPEPTALYRIHARNGYANKDNQLDEYLYTFKRARLFRAFQDSFGIESSEQLANLLAESRFPQNRRAAKIQRRYLRAMWRTEAGLIPRLKCLYKASLLAGGQQ